MKSIKQLFSILTTAGLMLSSVAFAAGGSVTNSQVFLGKFIFTPTPDAPVGATGKATVQSKVADAITNATFKLQVQGLEPDNYVLSVFRASDGSNVVVGQFAVGVGEKKISTSGIFSPEIAAPDIAVIVVSNLSTEVLAADLAAPTSESKAALHARAPFLAGPAAPQSGGTANLVRLRMSGQSTDTLTLTVSDVPPNTTFGVEINGTVLTTVASKKSGKLVLKKLTLTGIAIQSVRLLDEFSNEVGRVNF